MLQAQGHEVKIYRHVQHGEFRHVICWYTADGRQKRTLTDRAKAEIEAEGALRRLIAYGPGGRMIDRGTAELLDRLRAVDALEDLVPQIEAGARVLAGSGLTIEEACRMVAGAVPGEAGRLEAAVSRKRVPAYRQGAVR